jgi:hypothetical protein
VIQLIVTEVVVNPLELTDEMTGVPRVAKVKPEEVAGVPAELADVMAKV